MCSIASSTDGNNQSYYAFLKILLKRKGAIQLLTICAFLSFGFGTLGIAPAVTGDKYARLSYGYTGQTCSHASVNGVVPKECSMGEADAQSQSSLYGFIQYSLLFVTSPLIGALSDYWGRKVFFLFGIVCSSLGPLCLLLVQIIPNLSPTVYFISTAFPGIVSWFGLGFAIMADILPPALRALGMSLIQICSFAAISLIPQLAALYGHLIASIISFGFCVLAFFFCLFFLPETLSAENKEVTLRKFEEERQRGVTWLYTILRPAREMAILNRNSFFRLISGVVCLSALVKAGDRATLLYYLEGQLGFTDMGTADFIVFFSFFGLGAQTFLLKTLVDRIGERWVVIVAMFFGIMYNISYGVFESHFIVIATTAISSVSAMAYPTTASMMSYNVEEDEQGKIQGVFTSINAISSALGPVILNFVFRKTVGGAFFGAGSMFIVASMIYAVATIFSFLLPPEQANAKRNKRTSEMLDGLLGDDYCDETDRL